MVSSDAIKWTVTEGPFIDWYYAYWDNIIFGDGMFIVTARNDKYHPIVGTLRTAYSFDGKTWESLEIPPEMLDTRGYSFAYNNGRFVAVGSYQPSVMPTEPYQAMTLDIDWV